MTDVLPLYERGVDRFGALVHGAGPDDWRRRTPCSDWDVRALVEHVLVEQLWMPPLLAGETIAEVGDRFDGDMLGGDPAASWDAAAADARAAARSPGALDGIVHVSFGDIPAEEYVWQMLMDLTIHGWDLARGLGTDDTIDPGLVSAVHAHFAPQAAELAASGMFDAPPDVPDNASPQDRLLAFFGRKA